MAGVHYCFFGCERRGQVHEPRQSLLLSDPTVGSGFKAFKAAHLHPEPNERVVQPGPPKVPCTKALLALPKGVL